jgi:DNA-binding NarL/FixJ family response regulator
VIAGEDSGAGSGRGSRNRGIDCEAGERQHGGVSPRTPTLPRVLIVDDQPSFRRMAHTVLEWRGYVVVGEADSAASAIAAAERLAPDGVLLDICLGEASGFDVACTLTQARPELAVLLVSSIDYRQCEELVRDCGARGFVLKSDLACVELADFWPARGA